MLTRIGPVEFVEMGSSLKLCLVAEGAAHLYPRFGPTMEWDTAAAHMPSSRRPEAVLPIMTGKELEYNKEDLHNPHFMVAGGAALTSGKSFWSKFKILRTD